MQKKLMEKTRTSVTYGRPARAAFSFICAGASLSFRATQLGRFSSLKFNKLWYNKTDGKNYTRRN